MNADAVGIHPRNRSGQGLDIGECHSHCYEVVQQGFSWTKAADVTAIEAPGGEELQAATAFNDELAENSNGMFPKLKVLRLLSIGGAHTNGFLRVLLARSTTPIDALKAANST